MHSFKYSPSEKAFLAFCSFSASTKSTSGLDTWSAVYRWKKLSWVCELATSRQPLISNFAFLHRLLARVLARFVAKQLLIQWRSQPKIFSGQVFWQDTVSQKQKRTRHSRNVGGMPPVATPMIAFSENRNHFVAYQQYHYSGFTFSHYDLPFPTRYCIPYVRSGSYQLVICVKGIRVCALHCVWAWPPFASHSVLSIGVDTTLWESRVVCR